MQLPAHLVRFSGVLRNLKGLEMQDKAIALVVVVAAIQTYLTEFHSDQVWPFLMALTAAAVVELLRRSDGS
jgi:hypothetical protein